MAQPVKNRIFEKTNITINENHEHETGGTPYHHNKLNI